MDFSALDLTYDVCIISLLMLIAKLVRIRMRPLQNLFIPTALIAGFFGVLLGSHGLGVLTLSSQASSYAGILITVLFATMYLGKQSGAKFSTMMRNVGDTFLLNSAAEILQFGIALLVGGALLRVLFPQLTGWFALMMPSGFAGGHGTAAAVGGVLEKAGWADAVTIGQTFATFGLLGGVFSGVLMINYCARKGYTKVICRASDLPEEMKTGLVPADKQTSLGSGTISTMSMDPLTWHLVLIMVAVGASYLVGNAINRTFSVSVPTYGLALVAGVLLQGGLNRLKLGSYVDRRVVSRIGSSVTDYLVAFGVATIDVGVVMRYWQAILILCVLGFLVVWAYFMLVSRRLFCDHWVERGIYIWGWCTGVMSIAVLLLRIVDPEFKTGVLEDSGLAWIFVSFVDLALVTFLPILVAGGLGLTSGAVLILAGLALLGVCALRYGVRDKAGKVVFPASKRGE